VTDVRTRGMKVSCEDCFFRQNLLCAVSDAGRTAGSRSRGRSRPPANRSRYTPACSGVRSSRHSGLARLGRVVFAAVYWPLIIGFVCFVLVTILIGWIVDAPRRRGTDRH
jgi:hypothetical protein